MAYSVSLEKEEDWQVLLSFLPQGWEEKAKELKALRRGRKLKDAESLLRILLMHFATGDSLRSTVAQAKAGGLADISDVGLLKRVKNSGDWLLWLAQRLRESREVRAEGTEEEGPKGYIFKAVDGTTVQEPGATGTSCRIHYSFDLSSLYCSEAIVSTSATGEGLTNFTVKTNEVYVGDRAYGTVKGIAHVVNQGGQVLLRIRYSLPLYDKEGKRFHLLPQLNTIKTGEVKEWEIFVKNTNQLIKCRLCALKKNPADIEKTLSRIRRRSSRNGRETRSETLEYAKYVFVLTTLDAVAFSSQKILEIYRRRWQIELVFKRLKSLLQLGHLKKFDQEAIRAWLHGKLFFATLIECFIHAGETFSPWGYPLAVNCQP